MKRSMTLLLILLLPIPAIFADTLTTIDRKIYKGEMVSFRYGTIYFNVYKFGKIDRTERFPLYKVWKIEFNPPNQEVLDSAHQLEQQYRRLRSGKRSKRFTLAANQRWLDTNISVEIGQNIFFTATGAIKIDPEITVYPSGQHPLTIDNRKAVPSEPTGALIGKVGKNGDPFYIGTDKAPFPMSKKGSLYIGINDFHFEDNSGEFSITVYY